MELGTAHVVVFQELVDLGDEIQFLAQFGIGFHFFKLGDLFGQGQLCFTVRSNL
ncbi:hypothetical protein D3C80_2241640 [compost metagenome]